MTFFSIIYEKAASLLNPNRNLVRINMTTRFNGTLKHGASELSVNTLGKAADLADHAFATVIKYDGFKTKGNITEHDLAAYDKLSQMQMARDTFVLASLGATLAMSLVIVICLIFASIKYCLDGARLGIFAAVLVAFYAITI